MMLLGVLVGAGLAIGLAAASLIWLIVQAAIWIVLLPFRLLFALVALPFLILKVFLAVLLGLVFGALALAAVATVAGVALAVLVPTLPLLAVVALTWLFLRAMRRPAAA
jgi:hypothetical protein